MTRRIRPDVSPTPSRHAVTLHHNYVTPTDRHTCTKCALIGWFRDVSIVTLGGKNLTSRDLSTTHYFRFGWLSSGTRQNSQQTAVSQLAASRITEILLSTEWLLRKKERNPLEDISELQFSVLIQGSFADVLSRPVQRKAQLRKLNHLIMCRTITDQIVDVSQIIIWDVSFWRRRECEPEIVSHVTVWNCFVRSYFVRVEIRLLRNLPFYW